MNTCTCSTFDRSFEMTASSLSGLKDMHELYDYVEDLKEKELKESSIELILPDLEGYWSHSGPAQKSSIYWFQKPEIYQCQTCEQKWVVVLNESGFSYFFHAIGQEDWVCFRNYTHLGTKDPVQASLRASGNSSIVDG